MHACSYTVGGKKGCTPSTIVNPQLLSRPITFITTADDDLSGKQSFQPVTDSTYVDQMSAETFMEHILSVGPQ